MALSEKLRHSIFRKLSPIIGEEETAAVLSYFPARDIEELATKDHVLLETAVLRTEMADLRTGLHTGLAELRADLNTGLTELRADMNTGLAELRAELRAELNTGLADVRAELNTGLADVRAEVNSVRADLNKVRADLNTGLAEVRAEHAASDARIHRTLNRMFIALVTLQLTIAGGALAIAKM